MLIEVNQYHRIVPYKNKITILEVTRIGIVKVCKLAMIYLVSDDIGSGNVSNNKSSVAKSFLVIQ